MRFRNDLEVQNPCRNCGDGPAGISRYVGAGPQIMAGLLQYSHESVRMTATGPPIGSRSGWTPLNR